MKQHLDSFGPSPPLRGRAGGAATHDQGPVSRATPKPPRRSAWARAAELAARTPESRNRYADFLRAASITAVIFGHWLMAAPVQYDGAVELSHMLVLQPWTRWLTWAFQVMPVFFMVGGFSHCVSWESARRRGHRYPEWLAARLQRLVRPVLPLLLGWVTFATAARIAGVSASTVQLASQTALIPVWFLAVYVGVALLVPATYAAWTRWKMVTFWAPVLGAAALDVAFFALELRWLGWCNYALVWLAVHQLGYAWRDGVFARPSRALLLAFGGLAALVGMVFLGPYPLSMVGFPGMEVSNTLPPKASMLALAALQIGLLLALERPARAWLRRALPWTWAVLVNGMIMTVYLWHLTVLMVLVGIAHVAGGVGLTLEPGSAAWWLARPVWLAVLAVALQLFVAVFHRFEAGRGAAPVARGRTSMVAGSLMVSLGLAVLALQGLGGEGRLALRIAAVLMPFAGAELIGIGPFSRRRAKGSGAAAELG